MDTNQIKLGRPFSPDAVQIPENLPELNRWLFQIIQPYIKGRILELDSGSGGISALLIHEPGPLHLSDATSTYRDRLRERFGSVTAIHGVHNVDLFRPDFKEYFASRLDAFDTVIALNFTEHEVYDHMATDNASALLRKQGHLMIIMPAMTSFYSDRDQDLTLLKKQDRKFIKKFWGNDFDVMLTRYFNLKGGLGDFHNISPGLAVLTVVGKKV